MKYLILFLLLMFSCNVNAENFEIYVKDYHQKMWDDVRKTKTDGYSKSCLGKTIYGTVDYADYNCFMTYYVLLNENSHIEDITNTWIKNHLDMIRLKKHICADLLAKESDYSIANYKYFCRDLEREQRTYEYHKNDCMKNKPSYKLVCFSYKFE